MPEWLIAALPALLLALLFFCPILIVAIAIDRRSKADDERRPTYSQWVE